MPASKKQRRDSLLLSFYLASNCFKNSWKSAYVSNQHGCLGCSSHRKWWLCWFFSFGPRVKPFTKVCSPKTHLGALCNMPAWKTLIDLSNRTGISTRSKPPPSFPSWLLAQVCQRLAVGCHGQPLGARRWHLQNIAHLALRCSPRGGRRLVALHVCIAHGRGRLFYSQHGF